GRRIERDRHLSGTAVTGSLERPTRTASAGHLIAPWSVAALFGLAPRGVYLAVPVTRNAGGLLPHPFTHHLCARGRHRLVYSLLHVPSPRPSARRLPVRKHDALRCSDFPPRRKRRGDGPAGARLVSKRRPGRVVALDVQLRDRQSVKLMVDDDAPCVLASDDPVLLADLYLALRRNGEAGGGASLQRDDRTSITKPATKAHVGSEVARVDFFFGSGAAIFEGCLLLLRIVEDFLQLFTLRIEQFFEILQSGLGHLDR